MRGNRGVDFTQGSVLSNIVKMAIPMTLAYLVNVLYSVVDRIYIGHMPEIGSLALTGIGLGVYGVFLSEPVSDVLGGLACFTTMMLTVYRKLPKVDRPEEDYHL